MIQNTTELNSTEIYHLMAQTVIPRPIAWIVTEDEGVVNIAPFSFFTPLSADPATVIVSIGTKSDGSPKDTMANIIKNRRCTICMVDEYNLEKMHYSSAELDRSISEAKQYDIELESTFDSYPPRVQNATVAYACTLNQLIDLGDTRTQPIVLNIEQIYTHDTQQLKPVARVGRAYSFLGEDIEAPAMPSD